MRINVRIKQFRMVTGKHEIRMSKSETNPNVEIPMFETPDALPVAKLAKSFGWATRDSDSPKVLATFATARF